MARPVQQNCHGDLATAVLITSSPPVPARDNPARNPTPIMASPGDPASPRRHRLTDDELGAFLARADRLGHDPARLLAGEAAETLTGIPTLEQVRQLSNVGPAERRARQAVFFHPDVAVRSRLGQGVHDRCEAYVFADGIADDADRARLALHLPFPARLLSVLYRHVAAGEVWDLTVEHRVLGVDERDDLLNVVNLGELVIEPGGRVIVQGNLLVLGCQHLRHPAPAGAGGDYQIGVLPTPFSVDRRLGPRHGRPGAPGADGSPGRAGTRPEGVPTMLGLALSEPPGDGMNGTDGSDGERGGDGEPGRTGGAVKTAEITIGRLTGPLTLAAAGGRGGDGGAGGHGGAGGDGGHAGPGFRTMAGPVPPGRPGRGGRGGDGGTGGRGGNGGISSNVFVTLPERMAGQLRVVTYPAPGGTGGAGGRAGRGGPDGRNGSDPTAGDGREPAAGNADSRTPGNADGRTPGNADGRTAGNADSGAAGKTGRDGVRRPAPHVFVNARPLEGRTTSP